MTDRVPAPGLPERIRAAWQGGNVARPGLSLPVILAAAGTLADSDGVEAVTIRKVSAAVGCSAMALYRHVASRDELLLLVMDEALGAPPAWPSAEEAWDAGVSAWTAGLFERYLAHPWLLDLPLPGVPLTPRHASWVERLLTITEPLALDVDERLEAGLLLDGHARNIANLARARSGGATVSPAELLEVVPRADFPRLSAVLQGGQLQDEGTPSIGFGLAVILDGLRAQLARRGSARP
ncbi:TetR/AcrR family transcriptional regulator [Leifsonia sp. NPDC080035]|uniref:TetR/AcrR family transcriptional regulator n=1 Tax=Leifsonia sp. NPDC080035 TaxID=3143936 RepID=A0AAU7G6D0_9MICO